MSLPLFYPPAPESHRWVSKMHLFFFFSWPSRNKQGFSSKTSWGCFVDHTQM